VRASRLLHDVPVALPARRQFRADAAAAVPELLSLLAALQSSLGAGREPATSEPDRGLAGAWPALSDQSVLPPISAGIRHCIGRAGLVGAATADRPPSMVSGYRDTPVRDHRIGPGMGPLVEIRRHPSERVPPVERRRQSTQPLDRAP